MIQGCLAPLPPAPVEGHPVAPPCGVGWWGWMVVGGYLYIYICDDVCMQCMHACIDCIELIALH